jgi:DNA-binding response OmpR family regulator
MDKIVYIVDDDQDILEAVRFMLDAFGYKTVTDTGDEDIARKIKATKPNIVLLDILLSGKDGRDICKILKRNRTTKDIPVIMISAHADGANSIRTCGADDFVAKPFEMDEFMGKIEKYIN